MRFWGAALAAQKAQLRKGGSITFTIGWYCYHFPCPSLLIVHPGTALLHPLPTWSVIVGTIGSVDALARGLAVDLAPIRVNTVCPGYVDTEVRTRSIARELINLNLFHPAVGYCWNSRRREAKDLR